MHQKFICLPNLAASFGTLNGIIFFIKTLPSPSRFRSAVPKYFTSFYFIALFQLCRNHPGAYLYIFIFLSREFLIILQSLTNHFCNKMVIVIAVFKFRRGLKPPQPPHKYASGTPFVKKNSTQVSSLKIISIIHP